MRSFTSFALVAASFASVAQAHFRLQWPGPRGAFVADDEVNFCGNHINATTNRTDFPLDGSGFVAITSGHAPYTVGAIISLVTEADSFEDFKNSSGGDQLAITYSKAENSGSYCLPFNPSSLGLDGIKDGANATIQVVYSGGDGNLYQCADVTFRNTVSNLNKSVCTNSTGGDDHAHSSASGSASASAPAASQTGNGAIRSTAGAAALLGFVGTLVTLM